MNCTFFVFLFLFALFFHDASAITGVALRTKYIYNWYVACGTRYGGPGRLSCSTKDNPYGLAGNGAVGSLACDCGHQKAECTLAALGNVRDVAVGQRAICAIRDRDAKVVCWGNTLGGEWGNGTVGGSTGTPGEALVPAAIDVNSNFRTFCSLHSDGSVRLWGYNYDGQVGRDGPTNVATPFNPTELSSGQITSCSAGQSHSCVVDNGAVKCTGSNDAGELGDGTLTPRKAFGAASAPLDANMVRVECGLYTTCAVNATGAVYCTGSNGGGRLGISATCSPTSVLTAVLMAPPLDGTDPVVDIVLQYDSGCALTVSNKAYCWGNNDYGQVRMSGFDPSDACTPFELAGVRAAPFSFITSARRGACFEQENDGNIYCAGRNAHAQMSIGNAVSQYYPARVDWVNSCDETTDVPTSAPTSSPTAMPTSAPTDAPTDAPTTQPTDAPFNGPTTSPTKRPTKAPSVSPTQQPTDAPSSLPTKAPSAPTHTPTVAPTTSPRFGPSVSPTQEPTQAPSNTMQPTSVPTATPIVNPCGNNVIEPAFGEECDGGVCCTVDCKFADVNTQCGSSLGVCDRDDYCTGASADCPLPTANLVPVDTVCRPAPEVCDVPELCDGVSPLCGDDLFEPATTVCRKAQPHQPCDVTELCTGTSGVCPPDSVRPSTFVCREKREEVGTISCDVADRCDGVSKQCVADARLPAGHVCREKNASLACDVPEVCEGDDGAWACPLDAYLSEGTLCDDGEQCTGSVESETDDTCLLTGECRGAWVRCACTNDAECDDNNPCTSDRCAMGTCLQEAVGVGGTVCRAAAGVCDLEERCVDGIATCPDDEFKASSVVCRDLQGRCDVEERCTGASATCPDDTYLAYASVCRNTVVLPEPSCDLPELCTGDSPLCPDEERVKEPGTLCAESTKTHAYGCVAPSTCDGVSPECFSLQTQPNGAPCDDGNVCTAFDQCLNGVCRGVLACNCLSLFDCDDGDSCTEKNCEASHCVYGEFLPSTVTCDDEDECTVLDSCQSGTCVGIVPLGGEHGCPDGCDVHGACCGALCVCEAGWSGEACSVPNGGVDWCGDQACLVYWSTLGSAAPSGVLYGEMQVQNVSCTFAAVNGTEVFLFAGRYGVRGGAGTDVASLIDADEALLMTFAAPVRVLGVRVGEMDADDVVSVRVANSVNIDSLQPIADFDLDAASDGVLDLRELSVVCTTLLVRSVAGNGVTLEDVAIDVPSWTDADFSHVSTMITTVTMSATETALLVDDMGNSSAELVAGLVTSLVIVVILLVLVLVVVYVRTRTRHRHSDVPMRSPRSPRSHRSPHGAGTRSRSPRRMGSPRTLQTANGYNAPPPPSGNYVGGVHTRSTYQTLELRPDPTANPDSAANAAFYGETSLVQSNADAPDTAANTAFYGETSLVPSTATASYGTTTLVDDGDSQSSSHYNKPPGWRAQAHYDDAPVSPSLAAALASADPGDRASRLARIDRASNWTPDQAHAFGEDATN